MQKAAAAAPPQRSSLLLLMTVLDEMDTYVCSCSRKTAADALLEKTFAGTKAFISHYHSSTNQGVKGDREDLPKEQPPARRAAQQ